MPRSFDPYLGFGFRIFVDFLFTQSLSRLALVALWALVGMLLADIAPNFWRDSGLRHLYRQVCKDVRHVKRSVPRIRIKNDLPSVRLFNKSRSASSSASGSIRSDRATPSRSPAPSRPPTPGPARRQGPSPPGTFPDVSGWSETSTDVSNIRERVVIDPGPSPPLIPSREHAAYEYIDTTHVATSQTRNNTTQGTATTIAQTQNESVLFETVDTTYAAALQTRNITVQGTATTITQTQNESALLETVVDAVTLGATVASTSLKPIDDPSRHNPPPIPDDWVDINHPTPAQPNEPVPPFQCDPDSTPETQQGPPTPTQSRPISVLALPPAIDALPNIPDVDNVSRVSQPPDQIPLPQSRAASVIGGVYDQPQPRSALHDSIRSRVDKATSEIGADPARSLAPLVNTQSTNSQPASRGWMPWSRSGSGLKQSFDVDAPELPPKEEPVDLRKPDVSGTVQVSEPQISTPAQVDPPVSALTEPGDGPSLLLTTEPELKQQPQISKPDQTLAPSAGLDSSPVPPLGGADRGSTAGPRKSSLFNLPSPSRSPPPPFTEFAGVPEGPAAGEGPPEEDPVTQDEVPTVLTEEQKAAEQKRIAFLSTQVRELEGSRASLREKLDNVDDPNSRPAKAIESDLEDADKKLKSINLRMEKKKFSGESSISLV